MKRAITSDGAPKAIGPYSQAIRSGDLVFCSGQIGLDPATGELVTGGIEAETRRVLANLRAVLAADGLGVPHVLRATIYLIDLGDFAVVNGIWGETFVAPFPARATVEVSALPKGARIEVELIARAS